MDLYASYPSAVRRFCRHGADAARRLADVLHRQLRRDRARHLPRRRRPDLPRSSSMRQLRSLSLPVLIAGAVLDARHDCADSLHHPTAGAPVQLTIGLQPLPPLPADRASDQEPARRAGRHRSADTDLAVHAGAASAAHFSSAAYRRGSASPCRPAKVRLTGTATRRSRPAGCRARCRGRRGGSTPSPPFAPRRIDDRFSLS